MKVKLRKLGEMRDAPATHQVLQLSPSLFDHRVLALQDDAHARQIPDLRAAHNQRVNVHPPPSKDSRHSREHTGFILHKTVKNVPVQTISQSNPVSHAL